ENLSFTPWHAITAHEPLGEINLVRKEVYTQLSDLRHRMNGVEPREPSPSDPDPTDLPPQGGGDPTTMSQVLRDELGVIRDPRTQVEGPPQAGSVRERTPPAFGLGDRAAPALDGQPTPSAGNGSAAPSNDEDARLRQARRAALDEHTTGLALG